MLNTSVSLNSYLFQHLYTKYIKQLLEKMMVNTFFCMTQLLFFVLKFTQYKARESLKLKAYC